MECECGKIAKTKAGLSAHKRFCDFEGVAPQPHAVPEPPKEEVVLEPTDCEFKAGDWVQHVFMGDKWQVTDVKSGQVGRQINARSKKYYDTEHLRLYEKGI